MYVDDLIKELHLSGYGAYLDNLFVGSIFTLMIFASCQARVSGSKNC